MKNGTLLKIISIGVAALSLTSCSAIGNLINDLNSTTSTISDTEVSFENASASTITGDGYYKPGSLKYNYNNVTSKSAYNIDSVVSTGDQNILVIPVKIKNTTNATAANKTKIEKAFFGTASDTGWQSLKTYFYYASYGKLSISGVVSDWYDCGYTRSDLSTDTYMATLVDNATSWYKSTYNTNCVEFDKDSNGWIDCVCLIYSDSTYTTTENNQNKRNLWAYTYWQQQDNKNKSNPMANTYMWASYNFMNEASSISIDAHTYIHEFGHCLGLNDYYNYDSSSNYAAAGGFDMQDMNVGDHNPFSKMALGWATPYVVTGSTSITLRPTANYGDMILLNSNWNGSAFDEYILMEFYSPLGMNQFDSTHKTYSGYPQGPQTYGVRLYHIDARLYTFSSSTGKPLESIGYADSMSSNYSYEVAANNTTSGDSDYSTSVDEAKNFKQVHLISASGVNTVASGDYLSSSDLFISGKSFSMSSFSSFFVNSGKFNDKTSMSYKVTFSNLSSSGVTVTIA